MTIFMFANNINTTLASPVSSSATAITFSSTANLPTTIPSGTVLVITLNDVATKQNYEVVYATAITGATLTVVRAQEGTAALSWLTGDYAYSPPTAGQQGNFGQFGSANTWTGANTFTQPVVIGNGVASNEAVALGQFPSSLGTSGWKKYPDPTSTYGYYIEQWGAVLLGNGSNQSVTLPIAFPTSFMNSVCSYGAVPAINEVCGSAPGNLTTILIGNVSPTTNLIYYRAIGC